MKSDHDNSILNGCRMCISWLTPAARTLKSVEGRLTRCHWKRRGSEATSLGSKSLAVKPRSGSSRRLGNTTNLQIKTQPMVNGISDKCIHIIVMLDGTL